MSWVSRRESSGTERQARERAEAQFASNALRDAMEAEFVMFARRHKVDYLDARTLLMNATGL